MTSVKYNGGCMRRLTGLDGLRGIAVIAVVLYHADLGIVSGGFLGVDVFFVLSGFLITSILLNEILSSGTIDRANFYLRRIRRLFPAVIVVLIASIIAAGFWAHDAAYGVRRDLPWALTFVLNWSYLFFNQSYFVNLSRPPLLQHLWSLSIEEQFYVLWPLVLIALARVRRINLRVTVFSLAAVGAIASTLWMRHLAIVNGYPIPNDPSRLYFGTDTHAMGLLVGCALAAVWNSDKLNTYLTPDRRTLLNALGILSLAGLGYFFVGVAQFDELLYRGGFLALSIIVAGLIVVSSHPALRFGSFLGNSVLRWFGDRSYGIYLWHWFIFMLLRPSIDVQWPDIVTHIVRITLVLVIAELSYRYIEMPFRNGVLRKTLTTWRAVGVPKPTIFFLAISTAIAVAFVGASVRVLQAPMPTAANTAAFGGLTAIDEDPTPEPSATPTPAPSATQSEIPVPKPSPTIKPKPLVVFGDSVMLGSRVQLKETLGKISIDAAVGRQPSEIAKRINLRRNENRLGQDIVVHMGTNGIVTEGDLKPILDSLSDRRRVVVVNVQVPRVWMKPSNKVINSLVKNYPNVRLVDWYTASKGHRGYFVADGVHLTYKGAHVMATLIKAALEAP